MNVLPWRSGLVLRGGVETLVAAITCGLVGLGLVASAAQLVLPPSVVAVGAQLAPADSALRDELDIKRALIATIQQRDVHARAALESVRLLARVLPRGVTLARLDVGREILIDGRATDPQALDAYVATLRDTAGEVRFRGRERGVEGVSFSLVVGL